MTTAGAPGWDTTTNSTGSVGDNDAGYEVYGMVGVTPAQTLYGGTGGSGNQNGGGGGGGYFGGGGGGSGRTASGTCSSPPPAGIGVGGGTG